MKKLRRALRIVRSAFRLRRMLAALVVLAVVAAARLLASASTGELSRHYVAVIEPLVNGQMEAADELAPLIEEPSKLLAACETRVLPRYQAHLERARAFRTDHPVVRRLNTLVIEEYHAAISQARACLAAARARRTPDAHSALRAQRALDMARLRTALEKAYQEQDVRPVDLVD